MRKTSRNERGFSLLETVVVLGIIFVIAGMTAIKSFGTMESYRANSAMDIVVSQMRVARQLAISQRRNVQMQFNTAATPPTITYTVLAGTYTGSTEVNKPPVTVVLPQQVTFGGQASEPDTPMGFGTCSGAYGVCIANVSGGPAIMEFNSQGQFTDSTTVNPLNGTIFLVIPNTANTARAVTVMGATGRVREYYYTGGTTSAAWTE
jgi:type II secretory pathway pseudopilin PulG